MLELAMNGWLCWGLEVAATEGAACEEGRQEMWKALDKPTPEVVGLEEGCQWGYKGWALSRSSCGLDLPFMALARSVIVS